MRDFDSADRAAKIAIAAWSLAGALIGALLGVFVSRVTSIPAPLAIIGCALAGAAGVYLFANVIGQTAGDLLASVYSPARSTRDVNARLSLAESLVARGRYPEAAAEYRRQAELAPADPEPCFRLGRLHRDHLDDPEAAVLWYRQARSVAAEPGQELLAVRELIELFTRRIGDPGRAIPELARFLDRHPDSPAYGWAKAELERLRSETLG